MRIKCNPLWWFQSYQSYGRVIVLFVIFCIVSFLKVTEPIRPLLIPAFACIALVYWLIVLLSDFAFSFCLENGKLRYPYTHVVHKYKRHRCINTELTIHKIERVTLCQNRLERLFNTGHVIFEGDPSVKFVRAYKERYQTDAILYAPRKHTFYGIKDFEKFRNAIYDHVDPTILTIKVKD